MTNEEELTEIQNEYLRTKDETILGRMLDERLLPKFASIVMLRFNKKRNFRTGLTWEEEEDVVHTAPLVIINHIQKGLIVNTSFYGKMRDTINNLVRAKRNRRDYEGSFTDTGFKPYLNDQSKEIVFPNTRKQEADFLKEEKDFYNELYKEYGGLVAYVKKLKEDGLSIKEIENIMRNDKCLYINVEE